EPPMNRDAVVQALQAVFEKSPYFPFLLNCVPQFGVNVGRDGVLVHMDAAQQSVDFEYLEDTKKAQPPLWMKAREEDLVAHGGGGAAIPNLTVYPGAQELSPTVERLLMAVFMPPTVKRPVSDREDLVYASLFGFEEPQGI